MRARNPKIFHPNRVKRDSALPPSDDKSLATLLKEHDEAKILPFHMPGHKRAPFDFLFGAQKLDITEIEGFDNLHDASGVLKTASERAAALYGVKYSRFLIDGSTCGILAGIRAVTNAGDKILVARNCHKSVFNAIELCSLTPVYVRPTFFEEYGFYGSVLPGNVQAAFDQNPDIRLVVITSPTYEGVISDVQKIADICHARGAILFVDEAHGAHLGLDRKFEKSARQLGADIVVNSLHKTLPSLTQTALLHVVTDRVDIKAVDANLAMFESSSPSYVLMASIDGCMRFLAGDKNKSMNEWSNQLDVARKSLSRLRKLGLFEPKKDSRVFAYDKSKLVILCSGASTSGVELKNVLRKAYDIELEMASVNYCIAMTGLGDKEDSFSKLIDALFSLDDSLANRNGLVRQNPLKIAQKALEPYQIKGLSVETVDFDKSVGRICAENVWAYPPGAPIIVKGERIDFEFVKHATLEYENGVNVTSEMGTFPNGIIVVKEEK